MGIPGFEYALAYRIAESVPVAASARGLPMLPERSRCVIKPNLKPDSRLATSNTAKHFATAMLSVLGLKARIPKPYVPLGYVGRAALGLRKPRCNSMRQPQRSI